METFELEEPARKTLSQMRLRSERVRILGPPSDLGLLRRQLLELVKRKPYSIIDALLEVCSLFGNHFVVRLRAGATDRRTAFTSNVPIDLALVFGNPFQPRFAKAGVMELSLNICFRHNAKIRIAGNEVWATATFRALLGQTQGDNNDS